MPGTRVEQHLRADGGRPPAGPRAPRRRGPLIAAVALVLLACIGLGSDRPLWRIGGPPQLISPRSYAGDLLVVLLGVLAISPMIIRAVRGRKRGRGAVEDEPDPPPIRAPWWARVVAALAIALAVLISLLLLKVLPGAPHGLRHGGGVKPVRPDQPLAKPDSGSPPVHWWGIAGLVLVLLAGAAIAWRLRERPLPPRDRPEPDETSELVDALDVSLEEIESDPDPRRAVIRAYARMERALGAFGLARVPSETPLEYLARALASLNVGRRSIERLTALHERAKFSLHEVDGSMKAEALDALAALRDELAGAAA